MSYKDEDHRGQGESSCWIEVANLRSKLEIMNKELSQAKDSSNISHEHEKIDDAVDLIQGALDALDIENPAPDTMIADETSAFFSHASRGC